jgi:hypothetical protein
VRKPRVVYEPKVFFFFFFFFLQRKRISQREVLRWCNHDGFYNPEEGGEEAGVIDSDCSVLLNYGALENSTGKSSK